MTEFWIGISVILLFIIFALLIKISRMKDAYDKLGNDELKLRHNLTKSLREDLDIVREDNRKLVDQNHQLSVELAMYKGVIEAQGDHIVIREEIPVWNVLTTYKDGDKVFYKNVILTMKNGKFITDDGVTLDELRSQNFAKRSIDNEVSDTDPGMT